MPVMCSNYLTLASVGNDELCLAHAIAISEEVKRLDSKPRRIGCSVVFIGCFAHAADQIIQPELFLTYTNGMYPYLWVQIRYDQVAIDSTVVKDLVAKYDCVLIHEFSHNDPFFR